MFIGVKNVHWRSLKNHLRYCPTENSLFTVLPCARKVPGLCAFCCIFANLSTHQCAVPNNFTNFAKTFEKLSNLITTQPTR